MDIAFIAFTEKGLTLAKHLAQGLEQRGQNTSVTYGFGPKKVSHTKWAREKFEVADALVFIGATGIAVRTIAPLIQNKKDDPAVIVLDEMGQNCIPLLSGHLGGANNLARMLSDFCGANLVITTASDVNGVFAVDSWAASQNLLVPETAGIKLITAALLRGETVECATAFPIDGEAPQGVEIIPIHTAFKEDGRPRFHVGCRVDAVADLDVIVPVAVLGVGCRKGTTAERIEESAALFLEEAGIHPASLCCVASIDLKAEEPGLIEFAKNRDLPFVTFEAAVLNDQEGDFSASDFVSGITGTPCVCERAAVAAAEQLLTHKTVVNGITFAIALKNPHLNWDVANLPMSNTQAALQGKRRLSKQSGEMRIEDAESARLKAIRELVSQMSEQTCAMGALGAVADTMAATFDEEKAISTTGLEEGLNADIYESLFTPGSQKGQLTIVGLGPGDEAFMSQEAVATLRNAEVLCGYHVYVDLAKKVAPDTPVFTTPMTKEIDRCRAALEMAADGKHVAMVCSGDAGVYGMAGLCYELAHEFAPVKIHVVPGITAALSGASRLGAPLTHDFCVISLSDLLTPWELIEQRLAAAAGADFCIALYNPASHRRTDYLQKACDILLTNGKNADIICGVVRNIGRPGEETWAGTLRELRDFPADMFCTAFVGNKATTIIDGKMVTPRGYQKKKQWNKNEQ